MAKFTEMDRAEAGRLREAVKSLEAMLKAEGTTGGAASSTLLAGVLNSTQKKIDDLAQLEEQAVSEERERTVKDLEIAVAVKYEAALTAEENRQYQEFLSREYFTKGDFGKLEKFYGSAYDRLSENGKSEMSCRVWEGVRRDQYEFSELPENVKDKEAGRLRDQLRYKNPAAELGNIPGTDRADFIEAWDGDRKHDAYNVLERKSFAENVALTSKPHHAESVAVENASAAKKVAETVEKSPQPDRPVKSAEQPKEPEFSLSDLKLVDAPETPATPPLSGKHGSAPANQR